MYVGTFVSFGYLGRGATVRRKSWRGLMSVAVAVVSLVGCGGGGSSASSGSASQSSARTPDQLAADQNAADGSILQLADFPAGWDAKPRDPSTSDTPEAQAATKKFADCLGVDPALVGDQAESSKAKVKSDKFTDGHQLQVEASATVDASAAGQQEALTAFGKDGARSCFSEFFNAALSYALAHPSPGSTVPRGLTIGTIDVGQVNLPDVHGQSIAYRATVPVTIGSLTVKVSIDFVLVLKGRTGMTFTFQNVGAPFPHDVEVQLANTAIDRAPTT
jgi:hypothetical protein